MDFLSDKSLS